MSVTWETQMERELDERYSEWRERQTLEQLNDVGIGWTFVPVDNTWQAYQRDYGKKPDSAVLPKVLGFCAALAGFICLVHWWTA